MAAVLNSTRINPGKRNRNVGLHISITRRCRQPSRKLRRCGGRLRPSGQRVIGISSIRSLASLLLITISLASSIPGISRFMRRYASLLNPRRPQWASPTGVWKSRLRKPLRTGFPTRRCSHGMAPGLISSAQSGFP